jgi:exosortase/archaeosortase family protein
LVSHFNTITPIFSSGLLLILALRSSFSAPLPASSTTPSLATWRLVSFFGLHLVLIGTGLAFRDLWKGTHSAGFATALAASKYLILAPTAILLSRAQWRRFSRLYRGEWIAAIIALVSFFPLRILTMAWPWYGQVLGRSVFALAHLFLPGTQYVAALTPTLIGQNLEVTILFECGGLQAIKLFQILFTLVLVVDWNHLNRGRAVAAYFGGLAAMLIANALRITLLFVLGNTSLQHSVLEYHLTGGWIFFTLAFIMYLLVTYRWMLKKS